MKRQISIVVGVTLAGFAASSTLALSQDNPPAQEEARTALMAPASAEVSSGPIGASTQTMPAKLSSRNDTLDRLPIMSWPLPLNAEQRQQIYQAVMADGSKPANGAKTLKPAAHLSYEQTLEMHPLPQQLDRVEALQGLQYIKGEDKVLLVQPPSRIVVDQIGG